LDVSAPGDDDAHMSDAPATVLDAVNLLDADGYGASFILRGDGLHCAAGKGMHDVGQIEVVRVYRFEGPSDPDEEAIVYAIRCPVCGVGGSLVSAFGPGADPAVTDRLVMLDERFREQPDRSAGSHQRVPRSPDRPGGSVPESCGHLDLLEVNAPAVADGCVACLAAGGRWVHLRRCITCGYIGCCDNSPGRHATAHANSTPHPLIQSFEPGEDWFWCYPDELSFELDDGSPSPSHP